jgi:predicted phage terminase large subunit-like protein
MRSKLTQKQYELEVQRIMERMRAEAQPFEDLSETAKQERKDACKADMKLFGKTYFPHYVSKPCGDFHDDLLSMLDNPGQMCFFAGPRESGKTTWDALIAVVYYVVYEVKNFIVIVSENEDIAADYNNFVKLEFENNERLRADFGDLVGTGTWSKEDLVTKNNRRVWCRGYMQPVKGRRWMQHRPDYIACIDLESLTTTNNPRTVAMMKSKISGEIYGAMAETGTLFMEGQIIRKNCVLAQFIGEKNAEGDPKYKSSVWSALYDDDSRSYWPEGWSVAKLLNKKEMMGTVEWNRWMQNRPTDEQGAFREEWIRYYHPDELISRRLVTAMGGDPSMTSKMTSDDKAILTVSKDEEGIIYIRNAWIRRSSPVAFIQAVYNRYEDIHGISQVGIEENSLKDYLRDSVDNYAATKGYHLPWRPINSRMNKEDRIMRLSPLVERGKIRFVKGDSDQDKLIEQLLFFGQPGVKDDGADALEMAVQIVNRVTDLVMVVDAADNDPHWRQ